ncbi:hypothetical protein SAMN02910293_01785 [Streptococcus henryi]|uniref:Foldase protein PrsA n=1 Tax=Streptococcus henryi TaxID=439219 RepID=A0A1G6CTW2_9STRE|nr:cell wall synthase accessory phosphoprotein MacP [Streptococcus henryi]SDB36195.1 hypothetical protein SAMN02910293_01785 [Streptococcus henryi]
MGKPLLTDEIIERANRGDIIYDSEPLMDAEETKIINTDNATYNGDEFQKQSEGAFRKEDKASRKKTQQVYKSRRIENAKRSEFQQKLNKILIIVIILVILLFWAVFNL